MTNAGALLFALLAQVPMAPGRAPEPAAPSTDDLIDLYERHGQVALPFLAVLGLGAIVIGILRALRTQEMDGQRRAELKREVVLHLRREVGGMTAEKLAREVGLESFKLVTLLEEMQRDGLLTSHTSTQRLTLWRMKGTGSNG